MRPAIRHQEIKLDGYGWNWATFVGTKDELKWSRRDLAGLDAVIDRVPVRSVAVQAGGCLGVFAKRLAQLFETVYTFEPNPGTFPLLTANAPERNIVRLQAALGERHTLVGTKQVRRDGKHGLPHEGIAHVSGAGVIPTLRLDDLELPACNLLYLDLEGYELFALRGAAETVRRCRPVIAVEVNRNISHYGFTKDDVRAWLTAQGYTYVDQQQSDEVFVPTETL